MLDAGVVFENLLKATATDLRSTGFRRYGNGFFLQRGDYNWAVIAFQRHGRNSAGDHRFTINVGISSWRLRRFFNEDADPNTRPRIDDALECQRNVRIGFLLPEKEDKWWQIEDFDRADVLIHDVLAAINRAAVSESRDHLDDARLVDAWERGESGGLNLPWRLLYLGTLRCLLESPFGDDTLSDLAGWIEAYPRATGFEETARKALLRLQGEHPALVPRNEAFAAITESAG